MAARFARMWTDPFGLKSCKKCGLKTAPEYDVTGAVPGALPSTGMLNFGTTPGMILNAAK